MTNGASASQCAAMRASVGYGARSSPKRRALNTCGTRQQSAMPGVSPWQKRPVGAPGRVSISSNAAKPSAIQWLAQALRPSSPAPRVSPT